MFEALLNAFDPPAFFMGAPLWMVFVLPGLIMGAFTTIVSVVMVLLVSPLMGEEESTPKDWLCAAILGIAGGVILTVNIVAFALYWDGVLHPSLVAHGVTGDSPRLLADLVAFISNTAAFTIPSAFAAAVYRLADKVYDRRETRRKFLEARALERATRD